MGKLSTYLEYLDQLPMTDDPEVFGMHENANITFQQEETSKIIGTVLSIQPREVKSASGRSTDEIVADLAKEIESKLPAVLDRGQAGETTFRVSAAGIPDSLSVVLMQEMERFNRLLGVMRRTLFSIQKAILGEVVMSQELDAMYSSMLNNQVPDSWTKVSYLSMKPLSSWIKDLNARVNFMRDWLVNGPPKVFWLSGFFFPQGFLTGVLQTNARKYQKAIDTLNYSFHVLQLKDASEVKQGPEDGVYIEGLYLDGCRWDFDNQVLTDSKLGELFSAMPIIHFVPKQFYKPDPKDYSCPLYKTSVRAGVLSTTGQSTNFVLCVDLPTVQHPDFWVLKGAALLSQLNY